MKTFVVRAILTEVVKIDNVLYEVTWFNTGEFEKHPVSPVGCGFANVATPFICQPHEPIAQIDVPIPQRQKIGKKDVKNGNKRRKI